MVGAAMPGRAYRERWLLLTLELDERDERADADAEEVEPQQVAARDRAEPAAGRGLVVAGGEGERGDRGRAEGAAGVDDRERAQLRLRDRRDDVERDVDALAARVVGEREREQPGGALDEVQRLALKRHCAAA